MVRINGENKELDTMNIHDCLRQFGFNEDRVVVELNLEIIPRDEWASRLICDGDSVEILQFVGGG